MAEGSTLLNMEELTRNGKRKRRLELQKTLASKLHTASTPPSEANLKQFDEALHDPNWDELMALVEEMKMWDVVTTIPEPRSFLYHTRFHDLLGDMLADIGTYEPYLTRFIARFGAENELVALKAPPAGQGSQEKENKHRSGKSDAPIHCAVLQLHEGFLDWLLGRERTDVNLRNSTKETALAILCERYDNILNPNAKNPTKCDEDAGPQLARIRTLIERLLASGANFNICSGTLKLPIELLMRHGVTAGGESKAFVQQCIQQASSALVVVRTEGKVRLVGFLNNAQNVRVTEELLEIFLRYCDVGKFQEYWPKFTITEANVKKVIRLILHATLDQRLPECLRLVVDKGGQLIFCLANPPPARSERAKNACPAKDQRGSEMRHRVELKGVLRKACEMGDPGVLKLLVEKIVDPILLNDDPLLAVTLTKAFKTRKSADERAQLLACAEFLAKTQTIYMSKVDDSGHTPLHLALKYGFESVALELLKQRYAYLGLRSRDNFTPLDYGTYEFWKSYLDQCIDVEAVRGNDRPMVRFNLNGFEPYVPGKAAPEVHRGGRGGGGSGGGGGGTRSQRWKFIQDATSANHQPHRYERTVTEMTTLRLIAQSKELKPLLLHPVVHTFIMVKWMRLSHWNIINLLLTVLTAAFFGAFSLTACTRDGPDAVWRWLSVAATVLLAVREFLQVLYLRQSYLSFENLLDICNVCAMAVVLRNGCHGLVSSLVVISLAMQVTFLLGSLPFNSLSTMMYMFKTVSKNFLKSFLLFIPLIGAFIYAFYLTYSESPDEVAARDACTGDECAERNFNNFHTFWNATIKTLVMTTGELDASTFDFADGKLLVFLLFLFVAPIVIMNLINGLAVSDIAAIREESELISVVKKVMLLEQYERGVANVRPAFLRKLFPRPFFAEHNCWIQVRVKEFRKIEVHPRDKPAAPGGTAGPAAPGRTARAGAKPMGNTRKQDSAKFVPIAFFSCFGDGCSNTLLNFRVFKLSMFMRLDQSILTEALAIHEKRHPLLQKGNIASLTGTSEAAATVGKRAPRSPSPAVVAPPARATDQAHTDQLRKELKALKNQMSTLLELMGSNGKPSGKRHLKAKGLKRKARKRARLALRHTMIGYRGAGDQ